MWMLIIISFYINSKHLVTHKKKLKKNLITHKFTYVLLYIYLKWDDEFLQTLIRLMMMFIYLFYVILNS